MSLSERNRRELVRDKSGRVTLDWPTFDCQGARFDAAPPTCALDSGSTAKASTATAERARQMLRDIYAPPR